MTNADSLPIQVVLVSDIETGIKLMLAAQQVKDFHKGHIKKLSNDGKVEVTASFESEKSLALFFNLYVKVFLESYLK